MPVAAVASGNLAVKLIMPHVIIWKADWLRQGDKSSPIAPRCSCEKSSRSRFRRRFNELSRCKFKKELTDLLAHLVFGIVIPRLEDLNDIVLRSFPVDQHPRGRGGPFQDQRLPGIQMEERGPS